MNDISTLLTNIPRPLLLLLKTNDCLRSVDRCLVGGMVGWDMGGVNLPAHSPGTATCTHACTHVHEML